MVTRLKAEHVQRLIASLWFAARDVIKISYIQDLDISENERVRDVCQVASHKNGKLFCSGPPQTLNFTCFIPRKEVSLACIHTMHNSLFSWSFIKKKKKKKKSAI